MMNDKKNNMMDGKNQVLEMFRSMPVGKVIAKNCIPTMLMALMMLVYNLADTFFVAKMGDPLKVTAVSLVMPLFLVFMALGMAFGVGGVSVISRALGQGRLDYVKKVSSFCTWASMILGVTMAVVMLIFEEPLLRLIGASDDVIGFAHSYYVIIVLGGPFIILSNTYSNLLRAEGQANKAMVGMVGANLLNVVLDPILILVLGWGVSGAAIATVFSNFLATGFYLYFLLKGKSMLSVHPKNFTVKEKVFTGVLAIGVPAAIGPILMSLAQIVANTMVVAYGDLAVAGINVAARMTMIVSTLTTGLGQGVAPILGFAFGAGMWLRFRRVLKSALGIGTALAVGLTIVCYIFHRQFIGAFFPAGTQAYEFGVEFARILLSTSFMLSIIFVLLNTLQAIGAAVPSLIINLARQGVLYVPALIIGNALFGLKGLVWGQPVVDVITFALAICLYLYVAKKRLGSNDEPAKEGFPPPPDGGGLTPEMMPDSGEQPAPPPN